MPDSLPGVACRPTRGPGVEYRARMADESESGAAGVDAVIADLGDWRGERLAQIRDLTKQALPDVVEEIKWRKASNPLGVPTFSQDGILFTGESYKDKIKLTFAKGASLDDPAGLFNASLDAGTRRAIDLQEGDDVDPAAFKDLVRAAADLNAS